MDAGTAMDIPAGFESWQWQPHAIHQVTEVTAYLLQQPAEPDWQQLNRWYPECTEARLNNYWVCEIKGQFWTFFEFQQQQWVLMPLKQPSISQQSPLPLGLDLINMTRQNGYEVWIYFSQRPLSLLKRQLRFRLAQRIEQTIDLTGADDYWLLKGDDGRLLFTEQGSWTFVVLMR